MLPNQMRYQAAPLPDEGLLGEWPEIVDPVRHRAARNGVTLSRSLSRCDARPFQLLNFGPWVPILDGDHHAAAMYERHYSAAKSLTLRRARGTKLFLGPGRKLLLATPSRDALFAWRLERYRKDGQTGVECTIFRNEGDALSSDLIRAADAIPDARFGPLRHFTFVSAAKTAARRSRRSQPGQCFIEAGWEPCGMSKSGLHILERIPRRCPVKVAALPLAERIAS